MSARILVVVVFHSMKEVKFSNDRINSADKKSVLCRKANLPCVIYIMLYDPYYTQ